MRRTRILTLALLISASPGAAQQRGAESQPSVTFKAETNFVEVHAIVTDEKGAFVKDLTRDGLRGPRGRPAAGADSVLAGGSADRATVHAAGATEPIEPDVRATTRTFDGRIYIVLLDDLHTNVHAHDRRAGGRQAVHPAISRRQRSRRSGLHERTAGIRAGAHQQPPAPQGGDRQVSGAEASVGRGGEAGASQSADCEPEGAPDEPQEILTPEGLQKAESIGSVRRGAGANARRSLQAVENVANWMGDVQGRRKALLFFSEGFDYDIYQPFNLTAMAPRSSPRRRKRRPRRSARTSTSTGSIRAG